MGSGYFSALLLRRSTTVPLRDLETLAGKGAQDWREEAVDYCGVITFP